MRAAEMTERKDGVDTDFLRGLAKAHIASAEAANQYFHHYQLQREPWRTITTDREDYAQTVYEWRQVIMAANELDEVRKQTIPRFQDQAKMEGDK